MGEASGVVYAHCRLVFVSGRFCTRCPQLKIALHMRDLVEFYKTLLVTLSTQRWLYVTVLLTYVVIIIFLLIRK